MARVKVRLKSPGMRQLLSGTGVGADLKRRIDRVVQAAKSSGPVDSGEYVAGIQAVVEQHSDRVVAHAIATAPHSMLVELHTGNMARSLDAAAG